MPPPSSHPPRLISRALSVRPSPSFDPSSSRGSTGSRLSLDPAYWRPTAALEGRASHPGHGGHCRAPRPVPVAMERTRPGAPIPRLRYRVGRCSRALNARHALRHLDLPPPAAAPERIADRRSPTPPLSASPCADRDIFARNLVLACGIPSPSLGRLPLRKRSRTHTASCTCTARATMSSPRRRIETDVMKLCVSFSTPRCRAGHAIGSRMSLCVRARADLCRHYSTPSALRRCLAALPH